MYFLGNVAELHYSFHPVPLSHYVLFALDTVAFRLTYMDLVLEASCEACPGR